MEKFKVGDMVEVIKPCEDNCNTCKNLMKNGPHKVTQVDSERVKIQGWHFRFERVRHAGNLRYILVDGVETVVGENDNQPIE